MILGQTCGKKHTKQCSAENAGQHDRTDGNGTHGSPVIRDFSCALRSRHHQVLSQVLTNRTYAPFARRKFVRSLAGMRQVSVIRSPLWRRVYELNVTENTVNCDRGRPRHPATLAMRRDSPGGTLDSIMRL